MRIFRQEKIGDWGGVMNAVAEALKEAGARNAPRERGG